MLSWRDHPQLFKWVLNVIATILMREAEADLTTDRKEEGRVMETESEKRWKKGRSEGF